MSTQKVKAVDPRVDERWESLSRGGRGSLFTSPPWISAVCGAYGFTPEARIAADSDGEPVGGFAWVPIRDVRGERLSSLPFSDRAEPLVADIATWESVARDALKQDVPLTVRTLQPTPVVEDARLSIVAEAAWHGTPLDAPLEDLRSRLSSHARRNIRTAERNRIEVRSDTGLDAVRQFHRLHVKLRKSKYRLLAPPVQFFERIWHEFHPTDGICTLLAYLDDELVAGAMFLEWNGVLYYKFGASRSEHLGLRPNDAIFWAGIRRGTERAMQWVDWGLSDLDQPGLVAYKRKWATQERRIVTLRSAISTPPLRAEVDVMLSQLTELLTEESVPEDLTARAGALLYRYFC